MRSVLTVCEKNVHEKPVETCMKRITQLIFADTAKCTKCRMCAEICPMGVIEMPEGCFPEPAQCAYQLCINCGYCVDVCVVGALSHRVRKRSSNSAAAIKRYEALRKKSKRME